MKINSVTTRFARTGAPIIHIYRINDLETEYGLPKAPEVMPNLGGGHIFIKLDIGYRIFGSTRITETPKHPEPMV